MSKPVHISELLKGIDLAWWPEFLLNEWHSARVDDERRPDLVLEKRSSDK